MLLNVEGSAACNSDMSAIAHVMPLIISSSSFFAALEVQDHGSHIPQRLHRTCVLLWRLPKDEVPLAVVVR